ncbi:hypothetical protein LJ753_11040 [Arthrobacter sp. zg-Y20]|uniref:hypothetical protein n=1 Tax=unclassified Arthrobacter TaxID=235627 RepID=UPI001D148229|nr:MULTISPECIES: hypothetical protein [unclassified Arthrobacter]MCC3276405.1 hypothetical protein [Arthrobacter sp. zg-Y20]MDK1316564.1 hypothetical protein [Arthrobacter sp. zg.Y20]WIB06604.1 hypothetical protein QNO06_02340 [Arthrobacter sp. zg-Y20]
MDAATPEAGALTQYFRLLPASPAGPESPAVRKAAFEQSRRQQLAERTFNAASDTVKAIGTVRTFDRTGHILDALGHLIANAEATLASAKALEADIREKAGSKSADKGTVIDVQFDPATPLRVAQADFNRRVRPNA